MRTDIALLVAVDQLVAGLQAEQMRTYLVDTIDEMARDISARTPGGFALRRSR